jgi:sugar/nucleoside kinase (ribokinase family)
MTTEANRVSQRRELFVLGNIGHDIYILSPETAIQVPGGSAYRTGIGFAAARAKATILATVSSSPSVELIAEIESKGLTLELQNECSDSHNLFIFDLSAGAEEKPIALSTVGGKRKLADRLETALTTNFSIHIATMSHPEALSIAQFVRNRWPSALISGNVYWPYLDESSEELKQYLELLDLVFMNRREAHRIEEIEPSIFSRDSPIVIETHGPEGACVRLGGVELFGYAPEPRESKCTIGAGDVFIGAFLGHFVRKGDFGDALVFACEIAAETVTSYGLPANLGTFSELPSLEATSGDQHSVRRLRTSPTTLSLPTWAQIRLLKAAGLD